MRRLWSERRGSTTSWTPQCQTSGVSYHFCCMQTIYLFELQSRRGRTGKPIYECSVTAGYTRRRWKQVRRRKRLKLQQVEFLLYKGTTAPCSFKVNIVEFLYK